MDSEQCQGFQVEHNIGKAFMMLSYTFRVQQKLISPDAVVIMDAT